MTYGFASFSTCEFVYVKKSHVSCGNFMQKAALSDDSGLLVADGYKKWNVSAFLRVKVELCGYTAEGLLKDECLAGN